MNGLKTLVLLVALVIDVHAGNNAYANDINGCLFSNWPTGVGAVLTGTVPCTGTELCYSVDGANPALFAVCYSNITLIPEFAAQVVTPNIATPSKMKMKWHNDKGPFAPKPQSSESDYLCTLQSTLYPNYDTTKEQFCSRGHLVANADFSTNPERKITYVNTNIAPQWQAFNSINWAAVEKAVRDYANSSSVNRNVYVFTGTGGQAKRSDNQQAIKLQNGVVAPKYYWKAVCDPVAKASVVLVGDNSIGVINVTTVAGCAGKMQQMKNGLVNCYSLTEAATTFATEGFKLPPFSATNCATSTKGTFLDSFLTFP